jgi:hypothetical protein
MASAKDIMREEVMGRPFWLRPEWAASSYFVDLFLLSQSDFITARDRGHNQNLDARSAESVPSCP